MPIVKCPKCGKEYDSMYSFHSCEKKEGKGKQSGEDSIIKNITNQFSETFFGGLFAFGIPLILMASLVYFFIGIEDKILTILIFSTIISLIGILMGVFFSSEEKQKSKNGIIRKISLFFDMITGILVIIFISSLVSLLIYFFF